MTLALSCLAITTAVLAALRSTWSPCGLSMLSTITPMAERLRGRRWWLTASWFVVGASLGGLALGVLAAAGAAVVAVAGIGSSVALALAAAAALGAVAMDLGLAGAPLPHHRRQVDDTWLDQYRGWVYGLAFGAQIGSGLATYIMTAGVYLTVSLAALTGEPLFALVVGSTFGVVRGLAILLGVGLRDPERLRAFHARFEALRPAVRWAMVGAEAAVAIVALAVLPGVAGIFGAIAAVVLVVAMVLRSDASDRFTSEDLGGRVPADVGIHPARRAESAR